MSALVNFLTILDNYILKQTSKKHENRGIKYSKTRGLEDLRGAHSGARLNIRAEITHGPDN